MVFCFPPDNSTDVAINYVRDRLNEEHRNRVLKLNYVKLTKILANSEDATARGLAAHMASRLGLETPSR